jgi:hypothetical protein
MIKFPPISRRRLLAFVGAALASVALPLKRALVKPSFANPSRVRTRQRVDLDRGAHAIPDYARNPFLRPVGLPFTPLELARPTAPPRRGRGLGEDES